MGIRFIIRNLNQTDAMTHEAKSGRATVGALGRVEVENFVRDYCELRRKYLLRLAGLNDQEERTLTLARSVPSRLPLTSRAGNKRFIIGWLKRVNDLEKMCLKGDGAAG